MKSKNRMVNGTNGTDRTTRKVGTSRCPACGIRARPSGPPLPESVRCPRFSVRSSDMLKHGHHTLIELCFRCRRSLPWSAAVLCRFEDGIHNLKCVWAICGDSKAVEDYRTPRRYRDALACRIVRERTGARTALSAPFRLAHCSGTDAQQVLADCQCPTERGILTGCFTSFQLVSPGFSYQEKRIGTGRLKTGVFRRRGTFHLRERFSGIFTRLVAGCCIWLQLVAACCSYQEKFEEASVKREISTVQREIQDAETVLWAGCVALCRIMPRGRAEGGKFKVSGLKFKVAPLKTVAHCAVVARKLGWRAADCGFSGGFARPAILHPLSSSSLALKGCFTSFQLVSPGCTYDTLKHDKTRYF